MSDPFADTLVLDPEFATHAFLQPIAPGPEPGALLLAFARASGKIWMSEFGIYGCPCVNESLPLLQMVHLIRGDISNSLDVYQGCYHPGVGASAGSHDKGGPVDIGQFESRQLRTQRECGWGAQHRTRAQGFSADHNHMFPIGCPHGSPLAMSQQRAWQNGRNGLLGNGPITGPGPIGTETPHWKEGVKLMEAEIMSFADQVAAKVVAAQKKPPSSATIAKAVWNYGIASPGKSRELWTASHLTDWLARVSGGSSAKVDALANLVTVQSAQIAEQGRQITALTELVKGQAK